MTPLSPALKQGTAAAPTTDNPNNPGPKAIDTSSSVHQVAEREILQVVTVGHVDHGKSTLVGRLMVDTETIAPAKVQAVRELCERQGKRFEFAFLLDALEAEREQGITIDSARSFFQTDKRDYILVDAPGHVEFLRNMVSGAARTEAALLLIDAHEGVQENSRRHGKLLSLLGIKQMVVVVNKLDLIDFEQGRFEELVAEYGEFLKECGITPTHWVPMSARGGENVVFRSDKLDWWKGPTLLEALESLKRAPNLDRGPLRMPVQDIYKFNSKGNDERMVVGRIDSGRMKIGDEVIFSPSGKRSKIKALRQFAGPDPISAVAGENATIVLEDELFIPRGEIMHHKDDLPVTGQLLNGRIFWLGKRSLRVGGMYGMRLGTAELECEVVAIPSSTDAATLQTKFDQSHVERNEIAEVQLRLTHPIAADIDSGCPQTRRFVLLDGYDLWGGGQLLDLAPVPHHGRRAVDYLPDFEWQPQPIAAGRWQSIYGHKAGLVVIAGDRGQGKRQLAAKVTRDLVDAGIHTVLLDSLNVLGDAPRDTSLDTAREQLASQMRRTLAPLLGAGLVVVLTTNALGLADHAFLRNEFAEPQLTVLLSPDRNARLVDADVQIFGASRGEETLADLSQRIQTLVK
ncbi:MAG: 50S ribosome-binding GTPase [Myxococcales bacterium]|nr:50S ribosome-binding GTPase [Myxococcales bacterium]